MLLVIYCLLLHCVQHGHRAQTLLFDLRSGGTGGGYAQAVPSAQCLLVPYFSGYMCLCPCSTISVFLHLETYNAGTFGQLQFIL